MKAGAGEHVLLALDTATSRAVVALGRIDGSLIDEDTWAAGHRHGEELLERLRDLLARSGTDLASVGGIVVGTGPGAFTGLRVGLATAKGLAHTLAVPIAGVSTAEALLAAARAEGPHARAVLLPAGPSDRTLVRAGVATLLRSGDEVDLGPEDELVVVDLAGRAPDAAVARGERAVTGLATALLMLGAGRLAAGDGDDLARLVPEYVTLPRGVREEVGEMAWSRGHR